MIRLDGRPRYAALVLIVALLASFAVAAFRWRVEARSQHVELAMDYTDFAALARSYNYNTAAFLVALRRAGLTSLALTEELGANVGDDGRAYATTGAALLNQARLSPLRDPVLAALASSNRLARDAVYLVVYDRATYDRYREQLALHFEPKTVRVLRASKPWIIEVRTQIDYFNNTGLGIPSDQIALAKRLHLLVIPRFQNDERFQKPQFDAVFNDVLAQDRLVSTVIFFGLRNQVFGFPDHLPDAADAFKEHGAKSKSRPFTFGSIEAYDDSQIQKGNDTLAKLIPGQTVRVQAIAKTELDKISLDEAVGRYVLGVRERNVRVVYLRPWGHQDGPLSIEATNVEMVKDIATELKAHGFRLTDAAPIPLYRGDNAILVGLATLALPSVVVLGLAAFGYRRTWYAIAAYGFTIAVYAGGYLSHHDLLARSIVALLAALVLAKVAFLAYVKAYDDEPAEALSDQLVRSIGWTLLAVGVALVGALVVVGVMSSPLAMEEIERFRGVKAILALPPLIALGVYLFYGHFNDLGKRAKEIFATPVLFYQLLAGIIVVAAGVLLVMRSGNQSDISPSHFELALRHVLANTLSVRPRTKLFLIGVPAMMLVPALIRAHRNVVGWILALAVGVGIGDVIDTFSHLHTPLSISLLRIGNGLVVGVLLGILALWIYRRACITLGLLRVR